MKYRVYLNIRAGFEIEADNEESANTIAKRVVQNTETETLIQTAAWFDFYDVDITDIAVDDTSR